MTTTYETIKALAKSRKQKVNDLIVLAPQNDPFYCGTPADIRDAEWFAKLWFEAGFDKMGSVHLRGIHYHLVETEPPVRLPATLTWNKGKGKTDTYINNERCWKYLNQASKMARYLGLVNSEHFRDAKNPKPHVYAEYDNSKPEFYIDMPRISNWYYNVSGFNECNYQPYHLEVWCEKSTMDHILEPICEKYLANYVTFEGESSVKACEQLIERIKAARKPTRIFYVSDFDPAGNSIPVAMSRKVEYFIWQSGLSANVKTKSLVLTPEQIEFYNLTKSPIKDTEKRKDKFESNHGEGATELDALEVRHPGELARIVEAALSEYYSEETHREVVRKRRDFYSQVGLKVKAVTQKYEEQLAALNDMTKELGQVTMNIGPYMSTMAEPHLDDFGSDDWLYDSDREYIEQLVYYAAHKNGEGHES